LFALDGERYGAPICNLHLRIFLVWLRQPVAGSEIWRPALTYNYRRGAIVTFTRDDGEPGAGQSIEYDHLEGWKVEVQDEGCVEITQYGAASPAPATVLPWHRIWAITSRA
jgi:hypothetical protein